MGYQYNVSTDKCEEVGGSGCSGYVPFKSIEECQKNCVGRSGVEVDGHSQKDSEQGETKAE